MLILFATTFFTAISQVLMKKSAQIEMLDYLLPAKCIEDTNEKHQEYEDVYPDTV